MERLKIIYVTQTDHNRLKVEAVKKNLTMQALVKKILQEYFNRTDKQANH